MNYILSLILLFTFTGELSACSCEHTPFSVRDILDANIVFKGIAVEKHTMEKDVRLKFQIQEMIHGTYEEKYIYIYTRRFGEACGIQVDIGREIFIFSYIKNDEYHTNLCMKNTYVNEADKTYLYILYDFKNSNGARHWVDTKGDTIAYGRVENRTPIGFWTYYKEGALNRDGLFQNGQKQGTWNWYGKRNPDKEKEDDCHLPNVYYLVEYENGTRIGTVR